MSRATPPARTSFWMRALRRSWRSIATALPTSAKVPALPDLTPRPPLLGSALQWFAPPPCHSPPPGDTLRPYKGREGSNRSREEQKPGHSLPCRVSGEVGKGVAQRRVGLGKSGATVPAGGERGRLPRCVSEPARSADWRRHDSAARRRRAPQSVR